MKKNQWKTKELILINLLSNPDIKITRFEIENDMIDIQHDDNIRSVTKELTGSSTITIQIIKTNDRDNRTKKKT